MKKPILAMLAGTLLIFSACKKTGPQGPPGLDGNANVIGENPFTVNTWSLNNGLYSATFSDPNITPDIVDKGIVEIYKSYGVNTWSNLPDVYNGVSTVFDFFDNGFEIYVQNTDGSTASFPGTQTFRVVIISASQKLAHPNTNWKNYNEAMAALATTSAPASAQ